MVNTRVNTTDETDSEEVDSIKRRKGIDGHAIPSKGTTQIRTEGEPTAQVQPGPTLAVTNQDRPTTNPSVEDPAPSLQPPKDDHSDILSFVSLFEQATGKSIQDIMTEVKEEESKPKGNLERDAIFRKITRNAFKVMQKRGEKPKDSPPTSNPTGQAEQESTPPPAPKKPISYAKVAQATKPTENWTKVAKPKRKSRAPTTVDPAMTVEERLKAFLNTPPPQKPKGKSTKKDKPRNTAEEATKLRNLYVKCEKQLTGFGKDKQGNLPLSAIRNQFEILGVLSKSLKNIQYVGDNIELTVSETALLPVTKVLSKYSNSGLTISRTLIESEQATMDRLRLSCETLAKTAKFIDVRSFFEERSKELTAAPKEVTTEEQPAMEEEPTTAEEPQDTQDMDVEEPSNEEVLTQC
jgi:hypothetical protein